MHILYYSSKETIETPFLLACEQGDLRTVHNLLTGGAAAAAEQGPTSIATSRASGARNPLIHVDVTIRDAQLQQTGLHKAAAGGHLPVVRRLLAQTGIIDINARDSLGMTPLSWACVAGEFQAADKLLRSFADPNLVDKDGCSPLMLALAAPLWRCLYASEIQLEGIIRVIARIRALPEEEANKEIAARITAAGWTPAQAAQYARQQYGAVYCGIAKDLLRKRYGESAVGMQRASSTFRSVNGASALSLATALGHTTAVLLLIAGAKVDVDDACPRSGVTALMRAAGLGHADLVNVLCANRAEIDAVSDSGMTALMWAADAGQGAIIRFLIDRGATIDSISKDGYSALLLALCKATSSPAHQDVVLALLRRGADPNVGHFQGHSALHIAVANGSCTLVRYLLQYRAAAGPVNSSGYTPLMLALQLDNRAVIDVLLEFRGSGEVDLGLEMCVEGWTALSFAASRGDIGLVRKLCQLGADVNYTAPEGGTALLSAIKQGHTEVVNLLVDIGGADINARNRQGSSPLMVACLAQQPEVVASLLARGADPRVINHHGNTALIIALSIQNIEITDLLLQSGQELAVNSKNESSHSAMDYAATLPLAEDRIRITNILLSLGATPRIVAPQAPPVVHSPAPAWHHLEQQGQEQREEEQWGGWRTSSAIDAEEEVSTIGRGVEYEQAERPRGRSFASTALGVLKVINNFATGLDIGFTIGELLASI